MSEDAPDYATDSAALADHAVCDAHNIILLKHLIRCLYRRGAIPWSELHDIVDAITTDEDHRAHARDTGADTCPA